MKENEDIKQAKILPDLGPRGELASNDLRGTVESYSFNIYVRRADTNQVKTSSVISFSGKLKQPEEWRGLLVKAWVSCSDDLRFKDGPPALGTATFYPANAYGKEEAFFQLEHHVTLEFFRYAKELLESSVNEPSFTILLPYSSPRTQRTIPAAC